MRAQKLKTQPYKTGSTAKRLFLCLILCITVLSVTFSLRQKKPLPGIFSLSPTASPQASLPPPAGEERFAREITVTGRSWYALQLGAFTQENAAHQLSQEFIPRGAAGHIRKDGGIFRVYAAAYPTRAEAQSVQKRLSEQGVTTYIQACDTPALALRASGTSMQLDAVCEVIGYLDELSVKFFTLSSQLDKGEMTVSEASGALTSEGDTCRALCTLLTHAFDGTLPEAAQMLHRLLSQIALICETGQNSQSAARTGAALKGCQLCVISGISEIASALPQN